MASTILFHKYAAINELPVYKKKKVKGDRQRAINTLLLGTWVGITKESSKHYFVVTAGADGWIDKTHVSDDMGLKLFFIDVGQGDGVLMEFGNKKILVDGGPNSNLKNYLTKWQYSYVLDKNKKVHIDYIFISHFDADHYAGLIEIINDNRFTFGTIYHNGIARFGDKDERPSSYSTDLGKTIGKSKSKYLSTNFDSFSDLEKLFKKGGFTYTFNSFYAAVSGAIDGGRLKQIKRASYRSRNINFKSNNKNCQIEFLGPIPEKHRSSIKYKWFSDSSHTRNGHSLVLKINYEEISILLTGDLNKESQRYLIEKYKNKNPFKSDVTKGCHHGSSDFDIEFLKLIEPYATVISSGDNESHSHPRADALGASGKYSRGKLPKVYSTELARSVKSGGDILYGMINLRSLGSQIFMAQMKESKKPDLWDSYEIIES